MLNTPRAQNARTFIGLLVALLVVGGLLAGSLYLRERSRNRASGPSAEVVALANSYEHAVDLSDSSGAYPVWSPDGSMLAGRSYRSLVESMKAPVSVWDANSGKKLAVLSGIEEMRHIYWSPDSRLIAATTPTNTIYLLNIASANIERVLTVPLPPDFPKESAGHFPFITFSFNVHHVLWTLRERHLVTFTGIGARDGRSADGRGENRVGYETMQEWDVATGKLVRYTVLPSGGAQVSPAPDGEAVAVSWPVFITETNIKAMVWELWSVSEGRRRSRVNANLDKANRDMEKNVLWSPDASRFAAINERTLVVVNRADGSIERTLPGELPSTYTPTPYVPPPPELPLPVVTPNIPLPNPVPSKPPPGYTPAPTITPTPTATPDANLFQHIAGAAWSPNSKIIAAFHADMLRLWDADTSQLRAISRWALSGNDFYPDRAKLGWSPDGSMLAVLLSDNRLHLVDPATGVSIRVVGENVQDFAWSTKDAKLIIRTGNSGPVQVWLTTHHTEK